MIILMQEHPQHTHYDRDKYPRLWNWDSGYSDSIKLASLFLCMQTVLHISKSAVQRISEDLRDVLCFFKSIAHETIKDILVKRNINVDISVIYATNPFLVTTTEKECLSTDYRRNLYFKDNFSIIEPNEYLYDRRHTKKFCLCVLIPSAWTFVDQSTCFKWASFWSAVPPMDIFLNSHYFRENKLLGESNLVISIASYIDEFEVCNPLGTSRKKHKIVAIYWVTLNLPAKFCSNLHSIQLAALGKRDDIGHFGY